MLLEKKMKAKVACEVLGVFTINQQGIGTQVRVILPLSDC
jgi:hypothetical protein